MTPKFSLGISLPTKTPTNVNQKRRKITFDEDSDDEGRNATGCDAVDISAIGGINEPKPVQPEKTDSAARPAKRKIIESGGTPKPSVRPLSESSIFADNESMDKERKVKEDQGELGLRVGKPRISIGRGELVNLSSLHSSKKHTTEAEKLDPSIYSYDTVYDSLHTKPREKDAAKSSSGPRYMASLLRSAEVRKRDQLRARDRVLAKEREAEGEEFADKEKFVTAAYKAQQEELRRIEEEDAAREKEEEERRRKNGETGMVDFYREVLSRDEQRHEEALKAVDETIKQTRTGEAQEEDEAKCPEEKSEAQVAAELSARGVHVVVNDDGQVVDKRQLLSAGLNVAPKSKQPRSDSTSRSNIQPVGPKGRFGPGQAGKAAQRARQTEMIAAQLAEQSRKEEEAEQARQREIMERSRSRKSEKDVSSARERYLARKREREQAASKGG